MNLEDGRAQPDTKQAILDAMIEDAKRYWGDDLNDTQLNVVEAFYDPVAERLAQAQEDVSLILDSSQLEYADDQALDLLTALIGVTRDLAEPAVGEVTFSRDSDAPTDYLIPEGTTVQTDSNSPTRFETTDSVTLASGTRSVSAPVEAVEAGLDGNVGSNTVTVMPDAPNGVTSVTNDQAVDGGSARETDDELRARAKAELAEGSRASAPALVSSVQGVDGVSDVSIFINDGNTDQIGSSDKGFEIVAAGGDAAVIAQTIMDTKAAGDTSFGGYNGTGVSEQTDLGNGQTLPIDFSRPQTIQIYVDMSLDTTDEYAGDDEVMDNIVNYIGGLLSTGNDATGLGAGDDVLIGEVEYFIRDTPGVFDVTDLAIGTSSSPTGTSNIAIANSEVAVADATDGSITITQN